MQADVQRALQEQAVERALGAYGPGVEGLVAVVTGGARGIGRSVCEGYLRAGANVVAADKSWDGSDEFRDALESSGHGMAVQVDLRDDGQLDAAYESVIGRFGTADVLVNNAALVSETLFAPTGRVKMLDTKDEDWELMYSVNVFGVVKTIRRFIKPMIEKGSGSIINVMSRGALHLSQGGGYQALRPWSVEMPYQSTKAAVMTMTFYLADEVRAQGVAVNGMMPGHARASWFDTTARAHQEQGHVYSMRPMVPDHIIPVALFLAGQNARSLTGHVYPAPEWNLDHGYGSTSEWYDRAMPADIEEAFSQAESAGTAPRRATFARPG